MNNNTITNTLPIMTDSTGNRTIKFNLDISNALYYYDSDLPFEFIDNYLSLDRKKVIEDLENIIIHNCKINKERIADSFAPLHALFLLGELEAEESLPVILYMLSQREEYIEEILGDFLTEAVWMVITKIGKNRLEELEEFIKQPEVYLLSKSCVIDALIQIAFHYPEKREEVISIFDSLVDFILESTNDINLVDEGFNSFIIDALIDLSLTHYLPIVKMLYSKEFVDEGYLGEIDYVEDAFINGSGKTPKRELWGMNKIYEYYFNLFGGNFDFEKLDPDLDLFQDDYFVRENKKINRNDPCPCGSGKKFKKCCAGNGMYD